MELKSMVELSSSFSSLEEKGDVGPGRAHNRSLKSWKASKDSRVSVT